MVYQFGQQKYSMTEDQFSQVLDAILSGKYSWACVLILQSGGYNPLNYIPYRTYNRLVKENNHLPRRKQSKEKKDKKSQQFEHQTEGHLEVENLPHLRSLRHPSKHISGGSAWLDALEIQISRPFIRP